MLKTEDALSKRISIHKMLVPFIHWVRFVGLDTIQLEMIVGEEKEGTTYLSSLFHAWYTIQDTGFFLTGTP